MLPRELYLPAAGVDAAQWCSTSYIDGALTREEILTTSGASDAYHDFQRRISGDNGESWSPPEPIGDAALQLPSGGLVTSPGPCLFDKRLDIQYRPQLRRLWPNMEMYTFNWEGHRHPFNDHTFVVENGCVEKLLRYEDGPDYDPANPFDPAFCVSNRSYPGVNVECTDDGTAYFPFVCYRPGGEYGFNLGGLALMRRDPATGDWCPSTQQYLSPERSSRGVLEPGIGVLDGGDLLMVCRGSNTESTPGHKWFSVSIDRGRTLSRIEELRYDDGSQFYSPSSIHRFVRSSKNGKLYWLANIVDVPPNGNSPRYPLCIAEIDERKVAVKKGSIVTVDDRGPDEPEALQLSNFSVLENRETLDIEILMTRLGEKHDHFWQGAVYKYVFTPPR